MNCYLIKLPERMGYFPNVQTDNSSRKQCVWLDCDVRWIPHVIRKWTDVACVTCTFFRYSRHLKLQRVCRVCKDKKAQLNETYVRRCLSRYLWLVVTFTDVGILLVSISDIHYTCRLRIVYTYFYKLVQKQKKIYIMCKAIFFLKI